MKSSRYQVKVVCGFREDQEYTIDANEAHKAYYLFYNPEKRTIFSNGVALLGSDIRRIVPDLHATMGWNSLYKLTADDQNEIRQSGVHQKFAQILGMAKDIGQMGDLEDIAAPLHTLATGKYKELSEGSAFSRQLLGIA
jgi:hypothetical protein